MYYLFTNTARPVRNILFFYARKTNIHKRQLLKEEECDEEEEEDDGSEEEDDGGADGTWGSTRPNRRKASPNGDYEGLLLAAGLL